MWQAFTDVATNVGVSFENIILILIFFGGLIFYAKGFQVGLAIQSVLSGVAFILFYNYGYQYGAALTMFITTFVIMALSLYFMTKTQPSGGLA